MRTLLWVGAALVLACSVSARADEPTVAQDAQVTAGQESSDFQLLTPISEVEAKEVRGGGAIGPATYSAQCASAIGAAQAYLANYRATNGHPVGTIHRDNTTLLWLFP